MDEEILLPVSDYINIEEGLKYLNGNKKLYLKVLNSFLTRYQHFDINEIEEEKFKSEMHTLKGLSSTLGMESLSNIAKSLHKESNNELILKFNSILQSIIKDLKR